MLKIKNIYKIIGEELDCKWLPKTEGWIVRSVEEVGDTYIFGLDDKNLNWGGAEIQLRRDPMFNKETFHTQYELWAWNLENNKPERIMCQMNCINTTSEMALRLGMMLERILPTKQ